MILKGRSYQSGLPVICETEGDRIREVRSFPRSDTGKPEPIIGPGFVDLQVNGYGGVDYNLEQKDPLELAHITQKLFGKGVTSHLATIITNAPDVISRLIKQLVKAHRQDEGMQLSVPGIHLEGPFIAPQDGPRGAHPRAHVRPPDWSLMQRWIDDAEGLIRLITLSPEWEGAPDLIERCVGKGILVAIGHTSASHKQITEAVAAGASMSTHLGNAAHHLIQRHPNYLWSQLAADSLYASVIADGHHLPAEVLSVFMKVKGERLFLVSDSVAAAGMPAGKYETPIGGQVTLSPEGRLYMSENPDRLAGAGQSLLEDINWLVTQKLTSLHEAWSMAANRPVRFLEKQEAFSDGAPADIVTLDASGPQLRVIQTVKAGRVVYEAGKVSNY